jgi:hypothetical protein
MLRTLIVRLAFAIPAAMLAIACASDPAGPGQAPRAVGEYLAALPSWASFSPPLSDQPAAPAGPAAALAEDTVDVNQVEDDGSVTIIPDVVYACTQTPYSIRTNPTQIVMYSPDNEILWPGSLIQGKSHRDGIGGLLGLTIQERTPIRVSIPAIPSADNFREVASPDQARVAAAIGAMVGNATTANLPTPSTITFEKTESHSEEQLALSMRISGRYLGFSARASADFNRNGSETTVTAQFYQKMFEVVVAPPQTPGAFFSADFTQERLNEQIALNKMGPDNLPVYVSTVVYGRMMMVSMTASATAQEIAATLEASYNAVAGSGSLTLSPRQRTLLTESRVAVTSLGGDADATLAMIRSGDWREYFSQNAPLSSAAPLSYTFRNLSDGSIASVTEATEYNLKTCQARAASPGSFEFRSLVSASLGLPTPVRTLVGNVTGTGGTDLIFNHLGATNQLRVASADAAGGFVLAGAVTHPETPPEGWANYTPVVGDFNGDGRADVAWTHLSAATNKTYLALSNGDGTFGFPSVRNTETPGWAGMRTLVGDLNGDGCADLFWNLLGTNNSMRSGISDCAGNFRVGASQQPSNTGWSAFTATMGDADANLRSDAIWRSGATTYFGLANADGSLAIPAGAMTPMVHSTLGSLAGYVLLQGDINADGRIDMIWADTTAANQQRVGVSTSTGTGLTPRSVETLNYNVTEPLRVRTGDVNADGRVDLIYNTTGSVNRAFVALGKDDATFDNTPLSQLHPVSVTDWEQFSMLVTDVTGDGRADVVWFHPASTLRIYVGVARAPQ